MNQNVLTDRHKYIGGSDLPNIFDLNKKYGKTVYEFAKIKAGIIDNPFKGNEYTKYRTTHGTSNKGLYKCRI